MLKIRRLLPGEERVYNTADNTRLGTANETLLVTKSGARWPVSIVGDGQTIIESVSPYSIRFKDGGRTELIEALEEIANDTGNVRHARVVARRALREVAV